MNSSLSKLGIVVMTCDAYSDVWPAFYTLFKRYWPDCPCQIYHVSESLESEYDAGNINFVKTGDTKIWSEMFLLALKNVKEDYVLLLQEDFLLINYVQTNRLAGLVTVLDEEQAAYMRIFPCPGPSRNYKEFSDIGEVDKNSPFSVSCQATVWDKKSLIEIINPTEHILHFEFEGSKRIQSLNKTLLSLKLDELYPDDYQRASYPFNYFCTAVVQGKWVKDAVKLCSRENIVLNFKYRPVENIFDVFYRNYYHRLPSPLKFVFNFADFRLIRPLKRMIS